jgi:hypothetical protein
MTGMDRRMDLVSHVRNLSPLPRDANDSNIRAASEVGGVGERNRELMMRGTARAT